MSIFTFPEEHCRKKLFMKYFVNSQISFELRVKNLRQVCKNCNFHYQGNIFEEKFFWNTLWVHRFCSSFGWKIFSGSVKIAVYFSQRNFVGEREKVSFWKKNTFNNKFLRTSGEKFTGRAVKFHSNFQEEQFAQKLFVRKKFNPSECFSGFGWKIFGRFVRTAFYKFRGTFLENTFVGKKLKVRRFFSGFGRNVLGRIVNPTL